MSQQKQTTMEHRDQYHPRSHGVQQKIIPGTEEPVRANIPESHANPENPNASSSGVVLDLGSRWCPEEIEIFYTCKFAFPFFNNFWMSSEFQKYGCDWDRIVHALHEDEFSHRTHTHIKSFYEQVSFAFPALPHPLFLGSARDPLVTVNAAPMACLHPSGWIAGREKWLTVCMEWAGVVVAFFGFHLLVNFYCFNVDFNLLRIIKP